MDIDTNGVIQAFNAIKNSLNFTFELTGEQVDIITSVLQGNDTMGVLPTGSGKSMCFTLPPLIYKHITGHHRTALVISPLLALSEDQVGSMNERGIKAYMIRNGTSARETEEVRRGTAEVIFACPEAISDEDFRELITSAYKNKICLQVFDEAHCISEWGNDFRPSYLNVTELRSLIRCPALALSATMDYRIHREISNVLCFPQSSVIVAELPDRPNIFLSMKASSCRFQEELKWVNNHLQKKGINAKKVLIYTTTVKQCWKIFRWLWSSLSSEAYHNRDICSKNLMIAMYHAHIDNDSRERILNDFRKPDGVIRVLVATIAFGMGVQIPDIAVAVLWGLPRNLLEYWQEAGRCARDKSTKGLSVCYCYPASKTACKDTVLRDIVDTDKCLRKAILENFFIDGMKGDMPSPEGCDGKCSGDVCRCGKCTCCDRCTSTCQCTKKMMPEDITSYFTPAGLTQCAISIYSPGVLQLYSLLE